MWCNGSMSVSKTVGESSSLSTPAIDIGVERIGRNWIIQIKTSGECFTQPSQCLLFGLGSSIGRAADCGSVSCGFESHPSPHIDPNSKHT